MLSRGRCLLNKGGRSLSTAVAQTADVIVIGSGVIGTSVALELSRKGVKTLNVDAKAGVGMGSTGYSSGIIRMFYSTPDSCKMAYEGYHYWKNWEDHVQVKDDRGLAQYRECGSLILEVDANREWLRKIVTTFSELGLAHEKWGAAQVQEKLSWDLTAYGPPKRIDDENFGSATGEIGGGYFFPNCGYVSDPMLATQNLQLAAENSGASFLFNQRVAEVLVHDSVTGGGKRVGGVRLADGSELHAPVVVNVGGPESSIITKMLPSEFTKDMNMSTRAMRTEVAYLPSYPELQYGPDANSSTGGADGSPVGVVATDFDVGIYYRPEVGNKILIGNLEPDCDAPFEEFVDDPSAFNYAEQQLSEQFTNQVYRAALRMPSVALPGASDVQGVVAMYDVTEDWTPIYDKSALPGYYMAIGTSGNQFKNAGPVGKLMAMIIEEVEAGHDQDASPLPFQLTKSGHTVQTGSFSRLRTPRGMSNVIG